MKKELVDPEPLMPLWWLSAVGYESRQNRIIFAWAAPTICGRFQSFAVVTGNN